MRDRALKEAAGTLSSYDVVVDGNFKLSSFMGLRSRFLIDFPRGFSLLSNALAYSSTLSLYARP